METIVIIVALVIIVGLVYYNRSSKSLDINKDGRVTKEDAKVAVKTAVAGVKADVSTAKVAVKKAAVKAARKPRAPKV